MPLPISIEDPIVVVVDEDSWNAYSLHPTPTERDKELLRHLTELGGINEKVEPGTYHFNVARLDEKTILASLELIPLRK